MNDPYLDGIMRRVDRPLTALERLQLRLIDAAHRLGDAERELEAAQREHVAAAKALDEFEG